MAPYVIWNQMNLGVLMPYRLVLIIKGFVIYYYAINLDINRFKVLLMRESIIHIVVQISRLIYSYR